MATQIVSFSTALPHGTIPESYQEERTDPGQTFGVGASFHISANDLTSELGRPLQTAAELVLGHMRSVPPEIMNALPKDGASQHDHYIYGWPRRDA